jgi:hypothetical protein
MGTHWAFFQMLTAYVQHTFTYSSPLMRIVVAMMQIVPAALWRRISR